MRAGVILYRLYYKPLDTIRRALKTGLRRSAQMKAGRGEMALAAVHLRERFVAGEPANNVYFLSGKRYWFQTAFCLYSLQQAANSNITATVVDDGSFDDELATQALNQFPNSLRIVRMAEVEKWLDEKLPADRFPVLRERRLVYPHLRKLTDVHILPGNDVKLVLDSDMLFFREPTALLAWLRKPEGFLFMRDVQQSYGYSERLMARLCTPSPIPQKLNVGIAGIDSSAVDWVNLEKWTKVMLDEEGSSYLQEQALTAMIAATNDHTFLDESEYKVMPTINGTMIPEVLHHYVAEAKYDYFVKGWKHVIRASS